ncbi:MAG: hypothetical protein IPP46_12730 [Bacteroidetes bacterium]|nr:hypothetical protein [Bacteroidota bacterium]
MQGIGEDGQLDGLDLVEVLRIFQKAVIHIDTEQARHRHQSNLKTIYEEAVSHLVQNTFIL